MARLAVSRIAAYYSTEREPVRAVDGINFDLLEGEVLRTVGESACGKRTLGSALSRSMQPPGKIVAGSIVLGGEDLLAMTDKEFDRKARWKKWRWSFRVP